jgi:rhodanese-related sulfurtransferase
MKRLMSLAAVVWISLIIAGTEKDAYTTLAPADLSTWVTQGTSFDFLLIDVRDSSEMSNIIATDVCRPYHLSYNQGAFGTNSGKLPKDVAIVLYCASGHRSGLAAAKLDSAGFSSVYSLQNGFGAWTGPTKTYSYLKPLSDLPAPSMLRMTASGRREHTLYAPGFSLSLSNNRLVVVSAVVPAPHSLQVLDVAGRVVLLRENPFSHRTGFVLPPYIPAGTYFVRLKNDRRAFAIKIVD